MIVAAANIPSVDASPVCILKYFAIAPSVIGCNECNDARVGEIETLPWRLTWTLLGADRPPPVFFDAVEARGERAAAASNCSIIEGWRRRCVEMSLRSRDAACLAAAVVAANGERGRERGGQREKEWWKRRGGCVVRSLMRAESEAVNNNTRCMLRIAGISARRTIALYRMVCLAAL